MNTDYLAHEGVGHDDNPPGRGSGRYGWGTGENPNQHQFNFQSEVDRFKKRGMTETEIAKALLGPDKTSTDLRNEIAIAKTNERRNKTAQARELMARYGSATKVGKVMGMSESSVRHLLDPVLEAKNDKYLTTANLLKKRMEETQAGLNLSPGVAVSLGIKDNTLKVALAILEKEGYVLGNTLIPQQTSHDKKTNVAVICPPGTEYSEKIDKSGKKVKWINWMKTPIEQVQDYTPDDGHTWETVKFPESLSSSRIMIKYAEEGGTDRDGIIELRRGVKDLSLGNSQYAQVRIAVDGTHYLKGMAIYSDDLPDGIDVRFNTNKKLGTPMIDSDKGVLKPLKVNKETGKIDVDNPFGALIKRGGQYEYEGDDGKTHLSPINKLREEGEWAEWSKTLSAQFLSKQSEKLINQQIDISIADKKLELSQIQALTNPVIKKKMLMDYADGCDSNASDLSVLGFKRQAFQVLLPIPELKDNEVYAPNYADGDTVALVRYPHGGTFEIPILKVNNKSAAAKKVMNNAQDAIGITPATAGILSGADFDGDTALVIPVKSNNIKIESTANVDHPALNSLKAFDPKMYKLPEGKSPISEAYKQKQMGVVTNLITDMTAAGADFDELSRAVKHSMVVIDSVKHKLDVSASAKDQRVQELKQKYQNGGGASTIFSQANAGVYVPKEKEVRDVNKMTPEQRKAYENGAVIKVPTGDTKKIYAQKTDPSTMTAAELKAYKAGKKVYDYSKVVKTETVMKQVSGMSTVQDATELVHDKTNKKEMAYANYANTLKSLANEARAEARSIKPIPISQAAKKTYADEVASLDSKLNRVLANKPRENQAQKIAAQRSSVKIKANPDLDNEHKQRIKTQELQKARAEVGAHREAIEITDREWEAIQANAISTSKLERILEATDQDAFKKRATPRESSSTITSAMLANITAMYNSGMYSQADIAQRFGISTSIVSKAVRGELE